MEIDSLLRDTPGYYSMEEGELLRHYAKQVKAQNVIVEIGAYCGLSAGYLLAGSCEGNQPQLIFVDTWDLPTNAFPKFRKKQNKVKAHSHLQSVVSQYKINPPYVLYRSYSVDASKGFEDTIGLLHIDGNHSKKGVMADLYAWLPHVIPGGVVAMHDIQYTGVRGAVNDGLKPFARLIDAEGRLVVYEKS